MIRIYGELSKQDKKFLNQAIVSTLDFLTTRRHRKNTDVVLIIKEFQDHKYLGETTYEVLDGGHRKFTIHLAPSARNISKNPLIRYKKLLNTLFHELVHVKQWLNGELVQFQKSVRFKGEKYNFDPDDDLAYYGAPEEMEARGYEQYLYARFKKLVTQKPTEKPV